MLEELHVAGLGVVDDASLEFAPGLNVLTGETGAGKTMITVGLALALGARGGSQMVRIGRAAATVEARFRLADPPDGVLELLPEGVEGEADGIEMVAARAVGSDGRGSARLNGRLASVAMLADVGGRLVEIQGQNSSLRLLRPASQVAFLDRFAGAAHVALVDRYRSTHAELARARTGLDALDRAVREREREKDLLRYQIGEIETAAVREGELAMLAGEESRLAHAERILELAAGVEGALGAEGGAADRLREATASMQAVAALDRGAAVLGDRLHAAAVEAADLHDEVRAYRESVEVDPERLGSVQARLRAVKDLERKYGDGEEGILQYLSDAVARLGSLEGEEAEREALASRAAELGQEVRGLAGEISRERATAGPRLAAALVAEIRALGMPGADVVVDLTPQDEPGPDGAERVDLRFSGGPAQPLLPLARAASGGELSRVMLACRTVLADLDDIPTLVFDEVDAGIGGRTAVAVAERLAGLGRGRQILVVTHLAQIAARADRHFLVTKEDGAANVRPIEGEDRVRELARMLSGGTGDASLAHARELIGAAAG